MIRQQFLVARPYGEGATPATALDFQSIAKFWPDSLEQSEIIVALDDCARRAGLRTRFSKMDNLVDVRTTLFDCLSMHAFRGTFIQKFETLVPTLLEDVGERDSKDLLTDFHPVSKWKTLEHA